MPSNQAIDLKERIASLTIDYCRRNQVCIEVDQDGLKIWVTESTPESVVDNLRRFLAAPTFLVVIAHEEIEARINQQFEQIRKNQASTAGTISSHSITDSNAVLASLDDAGDLLSDQSAAPVVELVNQVLFEAVQQQASDIHFQPREDRLVVRMRLDGVLFDVQQISKSLQEEVLTRIKVAGRMDIAEKRLPQDGRATVRVGSKVIDLRIASMPASHGERIVIRLLDKSARLYSLPELGMDSLTLEKFRNAISVEHGLILVTGPTGSGKSTTLYSALKELNTDERNAVTLEDPIEYQLDGISQTQINLKKGMTFASGLRSILRQDPDIIMVGEIRDVETATLAVQAALTGHLVFSTLHTNDAASAITRLMDLGIEPYLLASSLVSVLAQRLVRRLCLRCRRNSDDATINGSLESMASAPFLGELLPVGCAECRGTGYRGRLGIYELLLVDESIRRLITRQSHSSELRDEAVRQGMRLLKDSGVAKIMDGQTSREEVERVTMRATL